MRTPKEYTENLKNNIITESMLLDCLYSANKRAKNYRDKAREYRAYYRSNRYAYDNHDISDLISNQFVQKVLALIDSKNYRFVVSENRNI